MLEHVFSFTLRIKTLNFQIPVYVGNESNLVVQTTNDGFHGSDGFNDANFNECPDLSKIKRQEMAHQAILRYTYEYPGKDNIRKAVLYTLLSNRGAICQS